MNERELAQKIEEIRDNFYKNCYQDILKQDFKRKVALIVYVTSISLCILFLLSFDIILQIFPSAFEIYLGCFLLLIIWVAILFWLKDPIEYTLQQRILAIFIRCLNNIEFKDSPYEYSLIRKTKMFYEGTDREISLFRDKSNDIEILMANIKYAVNRIKAHFYITLFQGIILKINTNTVSNCDLVIKKIYLKSEHVKDMKKLPSNDSLFYSQYEIYTDNVELAEKIITPEITDFLYNYYFEKTKLSSITLNKGEKDIVVTINFLLNYNIFDKSLLCSYANFERYEELYKSIVELQDLSAKLKENFLCRK